MFARLLLLLCAMLLLPLYADGVPAGTDLSRINQGNPNKSYRQRSFSAYLPLQEVSRRLKVGNYSSFENPTGIYFEKGEQINLTLHNAPDGDIKLIINDFRAGGKREEYALNEGQNNITVRADGLGYIDYRSPKGCEAKRVKISIKGGVINGIFSRHDTKETWVRLLKKLPAGILDMVGERCQVVFHDEGLRKGAPEQGVEMLALYDRIVEQQHQIMGWEAEGLHPGNHMMCRVIWQGFMHADGLGAAFHKDTIAGLSKPESLRQQSWGVAHELGHVNQPRPGFLWAGVAEISNNIYSSWSNYQLNPKDMRLEHEVTSTLDGHNLRGGRFDCYINAALVRRELWQYQSGPDFDGIKKIPSDHPGDHFVSVCPLWQLMLYFHVARGKTNFYPTIYHQIRQFNDAQTPHGQLRVNLCRYISDAAQLDMSAFLLQTGMLATMNRLVPDYGSHMLTITRGMVIDTIKKAYRYPEPDSTVIYYINANNVDIYRQKLALKPSKEFRPKIPRNGGQIVFPGNKWKNAVAFEVYEGRKLVRICLRGLGQVDNESTTVICPAGATAIRAVQWDGARCTVVKED